MADPGFAAGAIGWAVAKCLDKALDIVKRIVHFGKDYLILEARLLSLKPLVSAAINLAQNASNIEARAMYSSPSSTFSPEQVSESAVHTLLRQVELILKEVETVLETCVDVKYYAVATKLKLSKKISSICSRIKDCLLEGAPAALLAKIYAIEGVVTSRIENLSGRMEELANSYQESTEKDRQMYLLIEETRQELQKMNPVHDALQNNNVQQQSQPTSPVPEHPLVSRLKGLCKKTGRDKSCRVKLEIAAPGGRFHVPREIATSEEPEPPADRGKVVKGSFEVDNHSSVRLTIDVDFGEKRLFYILSLDHASPAAEPELFFPEEAGDQDCNSLDRRSKRVFPQKALFEDDPPTMKLNRTNNTPTDACERISLYLVIVTSFLQPDNPSQEIAIKDIDNYLSLIPQAVDTLVKHFQFDIKPARFLT